jgi:hypothetical protein
METKQMILMDKIFFKKGQITKVKYMVTEYMMIHFVKKWIKLTIG